MLVALFGATAPEGVVWYTSQFYALFYLTTVLRSAHLTVFIIMMVALTLGVSFFVAFGALSDRIGRQQDRNWSQARSNALPAIALARTWRRKPPPICPIWSTSANWSRISGT